VDYITIQELSRRTRIPERTLRRYIDRHKQFFTMRREGGVNFVTPEAAACAVKIRAGYDDGMTAAMIDELMKKQGAPVTVDVAGTGQAVTMTTAEALHKLSQAVAVPMAEMAEQQAAILETLAAMAGDLREEQERSQALSESLDAIRREVAAMRDPGGRGRDKGKAKAQAEILRELRATREALETAEARQKRQEKRLDEITEWTRPKPAEPEKRRRWWPWGR
jgi:DNA-binding transcriptional MerR regulator